MKLSGLNIFREYAKNFKLPLVLAVVPIFKSKAQRDQLSVIYINFCYSS